MNLFFWNPLAKNPTDRLNQPWILEGFQECVDGFWVWQDDQFYVSARLKERLGYDQLADKKFTTPNWWREFVHPDDIHMLKKFLKDIVNHKAKIFQIEIRVRHYHGHWVWFFVHCYIDTKNKNSLRVLGTFSDISSYRLLHDQLERTIEELENISQEKSHFIAHLNHEIRAPVNGILNGIENLRETAISNEQQEYINNISLCADLLLNLVNEVLDLSKIAAGKLELDPVEFDLSKVVHQIISMLAPAAARKDLVLELIIDKNLPHYLQADSLRLQQVIINLVNNAIKFTETGSVTLEVSPYYKKGIAKPHHILFRVIDTGHGIAKDILPRLFQDFTQATKSVTRTFGGTGLGLSICRKLVALMGGEIGAQSVIGKGSTFWFVIPFSPVEKTSEPPSDSSPHFSDNKEIPTNFHILIAEDNLISQQVLKGLLTSLNQNIMIANNGLEAVKAFKNHRFDLIFMDMNMPILDGFSATKKIRQMATGNDIPIIILTADTYSINQQEFLRKGVTQIIHKPITKDKLREILNFYQSQKSLAPINNTDSISDPLISELPKQPPHSSSFQHIDFPRIITLCQDIGHETVLHLLDDYVTEGRDMIRQLENGQDTYHLAHTLAGMSENMGITEVAKLSRQITMSVKAQKKDLDSFLPQIGNIFHQAVAEITKVKQEINSLLSKKSSQEKG